MNLRSFASIFRDLYDQVMDDLSSLSYAYATRAGVNPSPVPPPIAGEVGGAHPRRNGVGDSPYADELLWDASLSKRIMRARDLLGLMAGPRCLLVHDGSSCWERPELSPVAPGYWDGWCARCLCKAALDELSREGVRR